MIDVDPSLIFALDVLALLLTWISASVVLKILNKSSWKVTVQRGLGLAILSLVAFLGLRLVLPDIFILPLVFLFVLFVDTLSGNRPIDFQLRLTISFFVALSIVGTIVLFDELLRYFGYHLTLSV